MVFSTVGAAFGTAKSGIGITGLGQFKPELIMKSLIPVVMSGIIAVYGLVVSVLIAGKSDESSKCARSLPLSFFDERGGLWLRSRERERESERLEDDDRDEREEERELLESELDEREVRDLDEDPLLESESESEELELLEDELDVDGEL
ncbi:v-type proton ATPase 16 kDa proteolipid subunit 2 [Tulasnella sp. 408]|nr:v-type proton ATPase 16 kDa proteolipid subunit 2 [Tulasnella sp. 408]